MVLFGLGFAGFILGAVGTELLCVIKPEAIDNVENSAKKIVSSFCRSESEEESNNIE